MPSLLNVIWIQMLRETYRSNTTDTLQNDEVYSSMGVNNMGAREASSLIFLQGGLML